MVSTSSALSLSSLPKINFRFRNKHRTEQHRNELGLCFPFSLVNSRPLHSRKFTIKAAGGSNSKRGSSSRRVYRQSQAQAPVAPAKEIASFVLPAGAFVVVTFADSFMEIGGENPYAKTV